MNIEKLYSQVEKETEAAQTKSSTNSRVFNQRVNAYILAAIDSEGYDLEKQLETDREKLQFLADTFKREFMHDNTLRYYGTYQNCLANWIMGLPSCFNIAFENYRILEIAKEWRTLPQDATEKQEDKVLSNWFNLIAFKTMRLCQRHNISLFN
jgi:hypothetical protein